MKILGISLQLASFGWLVIVGLHYAAHTPVRFLQSWWAFTDSFPLPIAVTGWNAAWPALLAMVGAASGRALVCMAPKASQKQKESEV